MHIIAKLSQHQSQRSTPKIIGYNQGANPLRNQ
jgi:hypothetical protein